MKDIKDMSDQELFEYLKDMSDQELFEHFVQYGTINLRYHYAILKEMNNRNMKVQPNWHHSIGDE